MLMKVVMRTLEINKNRVRKICRDSKFCRALARPIGHGAMDGAMQSLSLRQNENAHH